MDSRFSIEVKPTHNELRIAAPISVGLVREIMEELTRTPGFPRRQAVWIFAPNVTPPPFPAFPGIVNVIRDYLSADVPDKRVALVVEGGLNRALMEMFRTEALGLPLELRVFLTVDDAVEWILERPQADGGLA